MNNLQAGIIASAILLIIAGVLVLVDLYLVYGDWFSLSDIHHETVSLSLWALALGLLIGVASGRSKK